MRYVFAWKYLSFLKEGIYFSLQTIRLAEKYSRDTLRLQVKILSLSKSLQTMWSIYTIVQKIQTLDRMVNR